MIRCRPYLSSFIGFLWVAVLWANQPASQPATIPLADVQRFTAAINQIKHFYINDISNQELFEHAIHGMLAGLDPHSAYLNTEDFQNLFTRTEGKFAGLGLEVTMEEDLVKVISPIDGTPAYEAGIQSGDLIIRINQHPVEGMSLKEAIEAMRGEIGSKVHLMIIRKNEPQPLTFELTRSEIHMQSVKSALLHEDVGYIRISHFQTNTAKDFLSHITKLNQQSKHGLTGLILDLRNNPGGLLSSAIEVSDAMIHNDEVGPEELIVYTKGRLPETEFQAIATPGDQLNGVPIVVLINEGSASGSEIVAGALQDNKRAILVGTQSFGKGSVQTILPLDEQHGIKLTTALYYTPSGQSIQAKGLQPDIVVQNIDLAEVKEPAMQHMLKLYEADLLDHITTEKERSVQSPNAMAAYKPHDYQLREAYNILKAMRLIAKQHPSQ